MKLSNAINELSTYIDKKDLRNEIVSNSTIGWQISHCLKVINGVAKLLEKSNSSDYKWQFSLARLIVFSMNRIPKGTAKAPKATRPLEEDLTKEKLEHYIKKGQANVELIKNVAPDAYFEHPYFKNLKRDKAIRFLEIHTEHHLKIIRAIAK